MRKKLLPFCSLLKELEQEGNSGGFTRLCFLLHGAANSFECGPQLSHHKVSKTSFASLSEYRVSCLPHISINLAQHLVST